jgi:hypothetical protein
VHQTFRDMNGGGINCYMTTEHAHAANLAVTRLETPDRGRVFEAIRHGTVTPYDISGSRLKRMSPQEIQRMIVHLLPIEKWEPRNESTVRRIRDDKKYREECADIMRAAASDRRAADIATTALVKDSDKLNKALNGEVVDLDITSVSLLTPDLLRATLKKNKSCGPNERRMWEDQLAAWKRLEEAPQTLAVADAQGNKRVVQARIRVNAFNFGVNKIAFQSKMISRLTGWDKSDDQNEKAMSSLIGDEAARGAPQLGGQVGEWLRKNERHDNKEHVRELGRQIRQMWVDRSYQSGEKEPYKMAKRIAVLNSMMGGDVCFNCKSGKDRTGECEVESKLLALQILDEGQVPKPESEATERDKKNLLEMATQGGNFEFQRLNTGAPGFKLTGVKALKDQVGGKSEFQTFRGLSHYIGS